MAVAPTVLALALVLSHVALFPAILYAYWRRLFVETSLLIAVLVASVAFHVCQVGWFCFGLDLHALQLTDHFMVYTALLWFSLYFVGAAERVRTAVTIAAMAIVLPVIATFIGSWMSGAIIVALVLVIATLVLLGVYFAHGGPPIAWASLLVAMVLLGAGVVLHVIGGDFGPDNWKYPVAHSLWHVLAMLALFYILDVPYKGESMAHTWITVGDRTKVPPFSKRKRRTNNRLQQQKQRGAPGSPRRSKLITLPEFNDGMAMII